MCVTAGAQERNKIVETWAGTEFHILGTVVFSQPDLNIDSRHSLCDLKQIT